MPDMEKIRTDLLEGSISISQARERFWAYGRDHSVRWAPLPRRRGRLWRFWEHCRADSGC
jgi:hypothetical protein